MPSTHSFTTSGARRAASLDELPDGTFVLDEGEPCLVLGTQLLRWTPGGYVRHPTRPKRARLEVITPPSLVTVLERTWTPVVPLLHASVEMARLR